MQDPNKLYFLLRRFYEDEIQDINTICHENHLNFYILVRKKLNTFQHDTLLGIPEVLENPESSGTSRIDVLGHIPTGPGSKYVRHDGPDFFSLFFQDNNVDQLEYLENLHYNVMFYLALVIIVLTWILVFSILSYFTKKNKSSTA